MTRNTSSDASVAEPALVESSLEAREVRLSDLALFFRKFVATGTTISSVVPSSRSLAMDVLGHVDWSRPSTIVELGAGTGAITELILDLLRPHHRFVTVERDPAFCEVLHRRFPDLPLVQSDVCRIAESMAGQGIEKVDYVLSGLPTPNLSKQGMVRLWQWLRRSLSPDGLFVQITVAPLLYRNFYRRLFESVSYKMTWMNLPPGGVYRCARPRRCLFKGAH